MSRVYAIPDIHGQLSLLTKLWDKLLTQEQLDLTKDKVIFLGDMVDRGPDSMGVLEFIKQLTEKWPSSVIALLGNHEAMMLMACARGLKDDKELWEYNGGIQTLQSYKAVGFSGPTQDHLLWITHLPWKYEDNGFYFSHAPLPREAYRNIVNRGTPHTIDEHTWTYHPDEKGLAKDHGNGVIGISGHMHALKKGIMAPRFYDNHYYLDSGCGCSKKAPLVAVEVKTKKVIYEWP